MHRRVILEIAIPAAKEPIIPAIPIKSAKYANPKQMKRAIDIMGSVTLSVESHFITRGTINTPATNTPMKNNTFFPTRSPNDTSSPVPKKLIINAKRTTTKISSTTAAPSVVVPSLVLKRFQLKLQQLLISSFSKTGLDHRINTISTYSSTPHIRPFERVLQHNNTPIIIGKYVA